MQPILDTPPTFAERVHDVACGAARALFLPTPVDRVVSFRGSFETRPDFGAGEELVQKLTVLMLDKGTRRRDRFAVAEALEDRGVQLRFYAAGFRCGFGVIDQHFAVTQHGRIRGIEAGAAFRQVFDVFIQKLMGSIAGSREVDRDTIQPEFIRNDSFIHPGIPVGHHIF